MSIVTANDIFDFAKLSDVQRTHYQSAVESQITIQESAIEDFLGRSIVSNEFSELTLLDGINATVLNNGYRILLLQQYYDTYYISSITMDGSIVDPTQYILNSGNIVFNGITCSSKVLKISGKYGFVDYSSDYQSWYPKAVIKKAIIIKVCCELRLIQDVEIEGTSLNGKQSSLDAEYSNIVKRFRLYSF